MISLGLSLLKKNVGFSALQTAEVELPEEFLLPKVYHFILSFALANMRYNDVKLINKGCSHLVEQLDDYC